LDFNTDSCTVREDRLLHRALSGDREALGSLFASHMPKLYRTALRVLGAPEEAEEALQDGLVQAVRHFREFEGRCRFSTWLTRIVINAALMRLRRSRRQAVTSIDQKPGGDDLSLAESISDPRPNPEEMYAQEERLQILKQKLRNLPAAYRSALHLRDFEGMNTREAAEALGLPLGTLKSQVHRARLKLVEEVGEIRGVTGATQNARRRGLPTRYRPVMELKDEATEPAA